MKSIFFAILWTVLCMQSLFAQETKKEASGETLYAKGLHACLKKEIEEYSKFTKRDLRKVIVSYDLYITRNLPEEFGEVKLQYRNDSQLAAMYKALSKSERERGIPVIKIFPLYDKEDK